MLFTMKKKQMQILLICLLMMSLTGCQVAGLNDQSNLETLEADIEGYQENILQLEETISEMVDLQTESTWPTQVEPLLKHALNAMALIESKDVVGLNKIISPTRGLRFTPYHYTDTEADIVFYPGDDILGLFDSPTEYIWGNWDGSGYEMWLDFSTYYEDFIYDEDFINAEMIGLNTSIGVSNDQNNVDIAYADDQYVEFHFTGFDPAYDGIDWSSLILVFDDDAPDYELVAIIHAQWTI